MVEHEYPQTWPQQIQIDTLTKWKITPAHFIELSNGIPEPIKMLIAFCLDPTPLIVSCVKIFCSVFVSQFETQFNLDYTRSSVPRRRVWERGDILCDWPHVVGGDCRRIFIFQPITPQ